MLVLVLCLGLACLSFDPLGYERRVPDPGSVVSVEVSGNLGGYPNDSGRWYNPSYSPITQPEDVAALTALHQAIVDQRGQWDSTGTDYMGVTLTYHLKSGAKLVRSYDLVPLYEEEENRPGTVTYALHALLEHRSFIQHLYGLDTARQGRVMGVSLTNMDWTRTSLNATLDSSPAVASEAVGKLLEDNSREVWQAVQQDFEEGTLGRRYLFDNELRSRNTCPVDLEFQFALPPGTRDGGNDFLWLDVTLTPQARHTLGLFEELGILEVYPDLALSWYEIDKSP